MWDSVTCRVMVRLSQWLCLYYSVCSLALKPSCHFSEMSVESDRDSVIDSEEDQDELVRSFYQYYFVFYYFFFLGNNFLFFLTAL